jgi:hypothetical protein
MGSRGTGLVLTIALLGLLALAAAPTSSGASARVGPLALTGSVKHRHVAWAREALPRMPLPRAKVRLVVGHYPDGGGAAYVHERRTLWLPTFPAWVGAERAYFLHELGHVADSHQLNPAERRAWMAAAGVPSCRWRKPCTTRRYGSTVDIPPEEMFAELYYACAAGTTRAAIEAAGEPTYGWLPDPAVERLLCDATAQWLRTPLR